ncbi:MAG: 1-acyl-sn-glycerol-3-phosphate acyltransferase [Spirosomataceae bacterium]
MRKFFLALYTFWAAFWFIFLYLLIFPFQYLCLQRASWKHYAHQLNRLWGHVFFLLIGMSIRIRYEGKQPDPNKAYVFCANHFSYLDIAVLMVVIKNYFAYMGKSDIVGIPLFGYMFSKLHIQVDRGSTSSRMGALKRSLQALQSQRSIMIFPEGGIKAKHPPQLYPQFQKGAFVMAIEYQVPVVPITQLNNHQLMPDVLPLRLRPGTVWIVMHEPIDTTGMTQQDVEPLKDRIYQLLQDTLNQHQQHPQHHKHLFRKLTLI